MDYKELSALSARFGDQNRNSSVAKAYETITAIAGISTVIEGCDNQGSVLTGASVLNSLTQTDGKIEYGTRELSVSELCGLQHFDATVTCVAGNVMTGFTVQNLSVASVEYSQIDDKFIKDGANIAQSKISGLTGDLGFISAEVDRLCSAISTDISCKYDQLCTAISCKVFIQNPDTPELSNGRYNECLSVIKLPIDAYERGVVNTQLCDDVLYIVDSDYVDMYGQEIRALSTPGAVGDSNAANTIYVDQQTAAASQALSGDLICVVGTVSSDLNAVISGKIKIGEYSKELQSGDLSVVTISDSDYYRLISTRSTLSNVVYVVSSDNLNAYGNRVISVDDPVEQTDAVNLQTLESKVPGAVASKVSSALAYVPQFSQILSDDSESFITGLGHDNMVRALLALKNIFAELSSAV